MVCRWCARCEKCFCIILGGVFHVMWLRFVGGTVLQCFFVFVRWIVVCKTSSREYLHVTTRSLVDFQQLKIKHENRAGCDDTAPAQTVSGETHAPRHKRDLLQSPYANSDGT